MKYNTTYTPRVSLKDTVKKTEYVIDELNKFYKSRFNITKVITPSFLEYGDDMLLDMTNITRHITFDITSEYKVGSFVLSHSNWMRSMIKKLKLEDHEGLSAEATTIWRDSEINPASSISRNEIIFQMKIDEKDDIQEVVKAETDLLFELIQQFEKEISAEYNLSLDFQEKNTYITPQMMENEYPELSTKAREEAFADELNGYVFKNPAVKLFSGHIHTNIPVEVYATRNFNQIVLKDFVNTSVLKVASIAQIANGGLLSDQLSLSDKANLKETKFYSDEIKSNFNIIEVKVNIGRLMMALLKKGHISEVQPGNISDESSVIASRYKVEKY